MNVIIGLLMVPLALLNFFGGIISGIWLAFLGEWAVIGIGLVALVGGHFLISLALIPMMAMAIPGGALAEKGHILSAITFTFFSNTYLALVMTIWCLGCFYILVGRLDSADAVIPCVIWSYGVALGPWMFMAQKEAQSSGGADMSSITTFFCQVAFVTMAIAFFVGPYSIERLAVFFGAVMAVGLIVTTTLQFFILRDYTVSAKNPDE